MVLRGGPCHPRISAQGCVSSEPHATWSSGVVPATHGSQHRAGGCRHVSSERSPFGFCLGLRVPSCSPWGAAEPPPRGCAHSHSRCSCIQLPALRNPLLRPSVQPFGGYLGVMEGFQGVVRLRVPTERELTVFSHLGSWRACGNREGSSLRASPSL